MNERTSRSIKFDNDKWVEAKAIAREMGLNGPADLIRSVFYEWLKKREK